SYSPDGKDMALVFVTQAFRNWKRYRGGWKANIHIYHFAGNTSEDISANEVAGDEFPMWSGHFIYFLSDRGKEVRMNLWRYDVSDRKMEQLTHFTDYDIHFPSLGPEEIVFEEGGKLCLFSLATQQVTEVKVTVVTDRSTLKPKMVSAEKFVQHAAISPDGKRALIEARGEVFSLPARDGFVKDLTRTTGAGERYPAWSPDGKTLAYWSDQSGEYELWVVPADGEGTPKKISRYGPGFRYRLTWSPDSRKLAFIDQAMKIKIIDIASGNTTEVDQALRFMDGGCENFNCSWSPDSRWLTYSRDLDNYHNAVFLFDTRNSKLQQVTDGFYSCDNPVFDSEGKYLYLTTSQSFTPYYSDLDNTFIYGNSTRLAAISLKKTTPSLLYPKNDTVSAVSEESKTQDNKKEDKKKDSSKNKVAEEKKPGAAPVDIDLDGLETRMILLPPPAGNYGKISSAKGKIIYLRLPVTGTKDGHPSLHYFDISKREEKNILENVNDYWLSSNTEKILVQREKAFVVISPEESQKFEKPLPLADMQMMVDPVLEWKQIFNDAWRLERDYFYDPGMHGVDWNLVKERYSKMLEGAITREEVNFIIGEMLGELNSSHTYHGGGDLEKEPRENVGYLGVDWLADGNYYKIKTILKAAPWDAEVHAALDVPGLDIKEGDYILAVNGVPISTAEEPFAFFQGLAKKTVELTYNTKPSLAGAKTAIVQTLDDEYRLRYLAWVEANRKKVDQETNGEAGYIYVPSTGLDGQEELTRQFDAQWNKKALVIDERFNSGGQIPDRFIEMLNRTPLAFWATRDGAVWPWPYAAHFGPKVMLINGWSGSGGDAFPD
ncbi:MAG TPA: PDZ domain-containing protein, partial [Puia sp.]